MAEKLNIGQRINAVRKTCPYIQKAKAVENYKAVTHDQVTAELRASLIEHGVLVLPRLTSGVTVDTTRRTSKGNPIFRFEGIFEVAFVNVDDLQDAIAVTVPAHADDQGDKAPGKATSYAVKTAMLKVFSIETGEDEESRIQDTSAPFTADELLIVADKQASCSDLDSLRAVTKEWAVAAAERGDGAARDRIIENGKKLAVAFEKPKVAAPTPVESTPPATATSGEEGTTPVAPTASEEKVSADMAKTIRAECEARGVPEAKVCESMKIERLEDLPRSAAKTVLKRLAAAKKS